MVHTSCSPVLVAVVTLAARAAGQVAPTTDVRVLALRNLHAGRTVRVAGRDIETLTGSFVDVRDGALWLQGRPANRGVPVAAIDSMWVKSGGHAAIGALVGVGIGSLVGLVAIQHKSCAPTTFGGCLSSGDYGKWAGITLGGLVVGALIGSVMKSWQLRYP